VVVDLESCRGTESPYVMISHVTSLKGLLILQLFSINKIHCRQSQDARIEHQQIHILDLQT
ncbi:hypothetical protein P692DRAFT_201666657, partial [Suillus brevipes Sb2]